MGPDGQRWLDDLPRLVGELEQAWGLDVEGRGLPGGSASWVGRARDADGRPRVLKIGMPGHDLDDEARVLGLAAGRGLVGLRAHDPGRNALLLDELGPSLEAAVLPVEEKLEHLAAALTLVWEIPASALTPPGPGEDKASTLTRLVLDTDTRLGHPTPPAVLDLALEYAARRVAAHDPDRCVVVHGDPHPANALSTAPAPGDDGLAYRLVDPDGFLADPAYDLGVVLREWTGRLGERPRERLEGWCTLLADRCRLDAQVVWEWAYLERVSTGLHVLDFGAERMGRRFLDSAATLLTGR
ncbi:streptomycin 6-kinase [Auraticoccus monumenti]|uniref:Streptomycin 6-kinase n=2 Tax=Auraticoccus monumenti TaxID=675864 RepID=A0A1G6UZS9_9ACTN|nr:streptomycin 6-kinase [Auraticoccus monumenti]